MDAVLRSLARSNLTAGQRAMIACVLEATARKPGNVHPDAPFDDLCYADFLAAAAAIRSPLDQTRELGVGPTVLECVRQTQSLVSSNVNLGIILLLAPLSAVPDDVPVAEGIHGVLGSLALDDARAVYEAIRLAQPGGLGRVAEQDVAGEPTESLCAVMVRAAQRDSIARQYENGFADVLWGASRLLHDQDSNWEHAVVHCYLSLLARQPDSLIARKLGVAEALEATRQAAAVLHAQWPTTPESRRMLEDCDCWLRAIGHQRNPGTTADLVAASLFVALRDHSAA